jgi:antirestriction protein ArdC
MTLPRRSNRKPYEGVNSIALWAVAHARGFSSPYWLTFKQAQALKATIRKGEHGAYVVYCGDTPAPDDQADDAADKAAPRRVLRGYTARRGMGSHNVQLI